MKGKEGKKKRDKLYIQQSPLATGFSKIRPIQGKALKGSDKALNPKPIP
jgi:hypothetical protein